MHISPSPEVVCFSLMLHLIKKKRKGAGLFLKGDFSEMSIDGESGRKELVELKTELKY